MKLLILSCLLSALALPCAWGEEDCQKRDEYQATSERIKEEVALLKKELESELSQSEMSEFLMDTPRSGSEWLQQQEKMEERFEPIHDEQTNTALYAILPGFMLALMTGVNYLEYFKYPTKSGKFFFEPVFRYVDGRLLTRISAGLIWLYALGRTGYLGYQYFSLDSDAADIQSKMEHLEILANLQDAITAKKRKLTHYQLLAKACGP